MQSSHNYSDQDLFVGVFSFEDGHNFFGKLIDSVCLHLAVLDNGNHDKFVTDFWSVRNAFDSAGQFDNFGEEKGLHTLLISVFGWKHCALIGLIIQVCIVFVVPKMYEWIEKGSI
jgi:hypothetical protein